MSITLKIFRVVAVLEGLSVLALFGVAMPLKYVAGDPSLVPPVGMAHGLLFLAFLATLTATHHSEGWSLKRSAAWAVSSILPFGTFVMEWQTFHRSPA